MCFCTCHSAHTLLLSVLSDHPYPKHVPCTGTSRPPTPILLLEKAPPAAGLCDRPSTDAAIPHDVSSTPPPLPPPSLPPPSLALCVAPCVMCLPHTSPGSPLGGVGRSLLLPHPSGITLGLMGLVEGDWVETLSTIEPEDVE